MGGTSVDAKNSPGRRRRRAEDEGPIVARWEPEREWRCPECAGWGVVTLKVPCRIQRDNGLDEPYVMPQCPECLGTGEQQGVPREKDIRACPLCGAHALRQAPDGRWGCVACDQWVEDSNLCSPDSNDGSSSRRTSSSMAGGRTARTNG